MNTRQLQNFFFRFMESRATFLVAIIVFRLILEAGYLYFVHPIYAYSGFVLEFSIIKYIESWILLYILMLLASHKLSKPSDFFILIFLLGLLVPLLSLYGLADQSRSTVYTVLMGYVIINSLRKGRKFTLPKIKNGLYIALGLAFVSAMVVTVWFFMSGGVANFNLDLRKVYEFRRATGELIHVGYMGYINTWATKVFGPFLLAYGLLKRNYFLIVLAISLHIFWFGVTAHKSVLFYPTIIVFLWFYFQRTKALSLLPLGYFVVIFASLSCYFLFDSVLPASLFIRRVFYVIGILTFDYYNFFGMNEFVYWSNSITSSLIDYPYDVNPALLIGMFRGTTAHANNSFISTGYMHAGLIGVIFYSIIAGLLFRLIDSLVSRNVPVWFVTALLAIPMRSMLLSADLPTALLSHGIAVGILLTFFARSGNATRLKLFSKSNIVQKKALYE
jgi:hypothetical protein